MSIGGVRLDESIARAGDIASLAPRRESALGIAGSAPMAGDQFGLGLGERRELGGNRSRGGVMQFLAALPQQGLVSCVLDQRVLEQIGGPRCHSAAKQQAGAGQRA